MMPQLSEAFGLTRDGRRVDGRPVLLRLLAVQPGGRRGDGSARAAHGRADRRGGRRRRRAAVRLGQQRRSRASAGSCRAPAASSRSSAPSTSRRTNFPAVARRDADRRDADVRHGRRLGGPVRRRPADRGGRAVEHASGSAWASSAWRSACCCSCCCPTRGAAPRDGRLAAASARRALRHVFRNPQSILCGMIAGLLFIPTTIFDMIWGVRYLQEAHGFDYGDGGDALGDGAARLDHRLPAARLRLRPHRPAQAGDRRRRASCCSRCLAWILYGPRRRAAALRARPRRRHRLGRGDAALHRDQGSQPAAR